jgi:hypothetical protein
MQQAKGAELPDAGRKRARMKRQNRESRLSESSRAIP